MTNTVNRENLSVRNGDLALWRWPQQGVLPPLHWAHATGFNARVYSPLLNELSKYFSVSAWDMRGHGESRQVGDLTLFEGWKTYYSDIGCMLRSSEEPVLLAGHSVGATASMVAAAKYPEKVLGLVLCDPVILDARGSLLLSMSKLLGQSDLSSYAKNASRRKKVFPSRADAFDAYRGKSVFAGWSDEWLRDYVSYGLVDRRDGQVELACAPAWEARTFETTEHNIWRWLGKPSWPVTILAADKGSTFPRAAHDKLQRRLPQAKINIVEGTSHFLPMEKPDLVVQACMTYADLTLRKSA